MTTKEERLKALNNMLEESFDITKVYDDNRIAVLSEIISEIENGDCISRQALYESLYERFHDEDAPNNITMVTLGSVRNFVKDFSPVTSTHGTCKDCKHIYCEHHEEICDIDEYDPNFYCADYEKRGNLDDSN